VEPSQMALVTRILPLAESYLQLSRFIQSQSESLRGGKPSTDGGLVKEALCEGIEHILNEQKVLVAQLETQLRQNNLTIQKLWFYLQPCLNTMLLLQDITTLVSVAPIVGGKLINLLLDLRIRHSGSLFLSFFLSFFLFLFPQ